MNPRRSNLASTRQAGSVLPALLVVACIVAFLFCLRRDDVDPARMEWKPVESANRALPDAIRVYSWESDGPPMRAWYVRVKERDPRVRTRVVGAADADGRETCSQIAQRTKAAVVLNAGYFGADERRTYHSGLLLEDGHVDTKANDFQTREDPNSNVTTPYEISRGAIGFTADDHVDIAWCATIDGVPYELPEPPKNRAGRPAQRMPRDMWKPWEVVDAVQAGPIVMHDGIIDVTDDEEVFFGSRIPLVNPRSAAGVTIEGDLILLCVDGRQDDSRGVSLDELAVILKSLGCVEALNLDGGGSSALVVNGALLNLPCGEPVEREIASALVVMVEP